MDKTRALMIELWEQGYSYEAIGRQLGITGRAVRKAIGTKTKAIQKTKEREITLENATKVFKDYRQKSKAVEEYRDMRHIILGAKQAEILSSITSQDIARASLRDKMIAYGILFDKERLELGQSTQNVELHYAKMVEKVHRTREAKELVKQNEGKTIDIEGVEVSKESE